MADLNLIKDKLQSARRDLLDLTTRNRLISTSRSSSRSSRLEIEDDLAEEIFRILVKDRKAMQADPPVGAAAQPAQSPRFSYKDWCNNPEGIRGRHRLSGRRDQAVPTHGPERQRLSVPGRVWTALLQYRQE